MYQIPQREKLLGYRGQPQGKKDWSPLNKDPSEDFWPYCTHVWKSSDNNLLMRHQNGFRNQCRGGLFVRFKSKKMRRKREEKCGWPCLNNIRSREKSSRWPKFMPRPLLQLILIEITSILSHLLPETLLIYYILTCLWPLLPVPLGSTRYRYYFCFLLCWLIGSYIVSD